MTQAQGLDCFLCLAMLIKLLFGVGTSLQQYKAGDYYKVMHDYN